MTTDGFLHPNRKLEADGLMQRKGFPESYDISALLAFLRDIKAGKGHVTAPVYSHLTYDIVPGQMITVDRPDIHQLANPGPEELVTIHIYSPPLTTVGMYLTDSPERSQVTLRHSVQDDLS